MVLFYLGQVPAQWFTEAGDAALAGGVLKFFEVGTSTPKAVYSDYQRVTAAGTTVTLDASGRANVFLDGLYSVQLFDASDPPVQIGPTVDGIGNAAMIGDGTTLVLETYDDLRAFDGDDFRACVLQGRAANGDGGAGLFVWDALETTADDGGTILAPSTLPLSGRWIRIRGETVDPRWYGCKMDGTTADDAQFAIAAAAAVGLKAWMHGESGYIRLASNFTLPVGSRVSMGVGAGFTATSGTPTITFPAGSTFSGSPACFGGTLQPIFSGIDTPVIPLSWMGGASTDATLDKWAAAAGMAGQVHLLDKSVSGIIPTFGTGMKLDVISGCLWTVNAIAQDLDVDVVYAGEDQWMDWGVIANVGTVNIGNRACPVGWFGAIGDLSDETAQLHVAIQTAWIQLGFGKYLHNDDISVAGLRIDGQIADACAVGTISATRSDMPISSLIIGDTFVLVATGDVAVNDAGFYASEGGIACDGTVSGRNSVFAIYDGATIDAASIDTQDCYASDPTVFVTTDDETTFHSNLKTNSLPGKRLYKNGIAVNDMYFLDEIGKSNDYDIVLTARNTDGMAQGKTSFSPERVSARYVQESGIEVTNIRFHWYDSGGTPHCDVYRSEVFVETFANNPAYYTIRNTDFAVIVVRIESWVSGWPSTSIIPSNVKPSNSVKAQIVNVTPSVSACFVGEVTPTYMHNTERLSIPSASSANIVASGIWMGDKWAFSA